jgi:drug/metabolite transporter (DMT)-like permease
LSSNSAYRYSREREAKPNDATKSLEKGVGAGAVKTISCWRQAFIRSAYIYIYRSAILTYHASHGMKNETIWFESLQTEPESGNLEEGESSSFYQPKVRTPSWICVEILREGIRHVSADWKILVFGQLLSFLLACGGAAQATLALDCNLSAPSFAIGLQYFVLSFSLIPVYLQGRRQRTEDHDRTQEILSVNGGSNHNNTGTPSSVAPYSFFLGRIPLQTPAWRYFLMAIMDVYANYFTVLAFKFTTITSVTVFDALAIPSAMILSRLFLSRRYTWIHLLGVASCMAGIVFNVLQDYEDDTNTGNDDAIARAYPHKLRGDCLAITGGILYGANNVLGEGKVTMLLLLPSSMYRWISSYTHALFTNFFFSRRAQ